MKRITLIFIFFLTLLANGFSQVEFSSDAMIFYKKGIGINVSVELTLSKDMTFVEQTLALSCIDRSTSTNTISGVFSFDSNNLILTPQKQLFYDFQGNCLKLEGTENILKENPLFLTKYKIVKYQNLILLLNDSISSSNFSNDFIDIANAINKKDGEVNIEYFWKNKDDHSITVNKDISTSFPGPWNEYILNQPLKGKTISLTNISKEDKIRAIFQGIPPKYLFSLDIGKESGVRKGMKFYARGKNECLCEMIIIEINENDCKGFIRQYQEEECKNILEFGTKE